MAKQGRLCRERKTAVKPSEVKRGHVIRWQGDLWKVVRITHITPGNKRAHFQIEMKNVRQGRVLTNRFAAHDDVEFVEVEKRSMQYLYREGPNHCFMDNESYEQIMISDDEIADEVQFLRHNEDVTVQFVEGSPLALELPAAVVLEVAETDPGMKGDSVSNVFKPAKLETGLEVKVPLHVNPGDLVKVDTRTGEFLERAAR
jgi:elongation factor P